jgi:hypothetical protein
MWILSESSYNKLKVIYRQKAEKNNSHLHTNRITVRIQYTEQSRTVKRKDTTLKILLAIEEETNKRRQFLIYRRVCISISLVLTHKAQGGSRT